jgi:oligopeptide/dipeptide ABC transporter ATP-binding protein
MRGGGMIDDGFHLESALMFAFGDLRRMPHKIIDIRNLSVAFGSKKGGTRVVSDISLDIKSGEVFGLVGESGSGKSITALSILRILPDNALATGEILFRGNDLLSLPEEEMRGVRGRDISMIFQEPMTSLNPVLTVGYQIAEALLAHFDMPKKEAMSSAVGLLKAVRMPAPEMRIRDYPHQLSGGMRQRVMIAIAIACNPSLLIADEPTTALDVTIQAQILDLLQGLREERQMAVLLITHDLSIISEQAERVAVMYAGRIMELASARELFGNTCHPYTRGLIKSLPDRKGMPLNPIPGFVPSPDQYPGGCKFSDRCEMAIAECRMAEPELAEITTGHFVRCIRVNE